MSTSDLSCANDTRNGIPILLVEFTTIGGVVFDHLLYKWKIGEGYVSMLILTC